MVRAFKVTQSDSFTAQPVAAGEKLIVRSTSAADVSPLTLTASGTVAAVASAEDLDLSTIDGQIEQQSAQSYTALTMLKLDGAPAGTVTIRGQGTKANGSIYCLTVPTEGTTLSPGLTGFAQALTFRNPCRETILCPAGAALVTGVAPGSYVKITLNAVVKYFWFSNGTTTDPAPGGTGYAVTFTGGDANTVIAAALLASMGTNLTNFASSLSTATITITGIALGVITISQDAGADFTLTAVQAGTADAAYQIRTGYTTGGVAATPTDIADFIDRALDASGTAGAHYGTGTAANPYLTSSNSVGVVTITDRLACARRLAWSIAQSAAHFSIVLPAGGIDGTLLATLDATGYSVSLPMEFNNGGLSAVLSGGVGLLLARSTPTTDELYVGGHWSTIHIVGGVMPTGAVKLRIEISDDATHWRNSGLTILDVNDSDDPYVLAPCEYLRGVITENPNVTDVPLHFAVVTP